jgi:hypothetical protein
MAGPYLALQQRSTLPLARCAQLTSVLAGQRRRDQVVDAAVYHYGSDGGPPKDGCGRCARSVPERAGNFQTVPIRYRFGYYLRTCSIFAAS